LLRRDEFFPGEEDEAFIQLSHSHIHYHHHSHTHVLLIPISITRKALLSIYEAALLALTALNGGEYTQLNYYTGQCSHCTITHHVEQWSGVQYDQFRHSYTNLYNDRQWGVRYTRLDIP
jgi:hypothetical protein